MCQHSCCKKGARKRSETLKALEDAVRHFRRSNAERNASTFGIGGKFHSLHRSRSFSEGSGSYQALSGSHQSPSPHHLQKRTRSRALCSIGVSSPGRRLGSCGRRLRFLARKTAERLTRNLMKEYRPHAAGSGRPVLTTVWLQFRFPPSRMALMLRPVLR